MQMLLPLMKSTITMLESTVSLEMLALLQTVKVCRDHQRLIATLCRVHLGQDKLRLEVARRSVYYLLVLQYDFRYGLFFLFRFYYF